jgi:predicted GNAT family acetyltransferase
VRRLGAGDAGPLAGLGEASAWIANTWGGPEGLAASGTAWGAFAGSRLVAVACPFFVGTVYEDLGVVTEPGFRRLGLSTACAGPVCQDVRGRGRVPSWTTSPDNAASLGVAAKLGFTFQRRDRLLVVDVPVSVPDP